MSKLDLKGFQQTLLATSDDGELIDFCRKHVLHGTPFVFEGREDQFYDFQKRIATEYDISFHQVFITGSGKLGFSPLKETKFSYDSDIDVAIVSESLFDQYMEHIRKYQMEVRRARNSLTEREISEYHTFLEYIAIGWMRPDKLPLSFQIGVLKCNWFAFFESLSHGKSEVGNYKVSGGVFKSYRHLEAYSMSGMKELKRKLEVRRIK